MNIQLQILIMKKLFFSFHPISSNIIILNIQYYSKTSLKLFILLSFAFAHLIYFPCPVSRTQFSNSRKFSSLEKDKRKNLTKIFPSIFVDPWSSLVHPAFCLSTVIVLRVSKEIVAAKYLFWTSTLEKCAKFLASCDPCL